MAAFDKRLIILVTLATLAMHSRQHCIHASSAQSTMIQPISDADWKTTSSNTISSSPFLDDDAADLYAINVPPLSVECIGSECDSLLEGRQHQQAIQIGELDRRRRGSSRSLHQAIENGAQKAVFARIAARSSGRSRFVPWGGKRSDATTLLYPIEVGSKRGGFQPWGGKRDAVLVGRGSWRPSKVETWNNVDKLNNVKTWNNVETWNTVRG